MKCSRQRCQVDVGTFDVAALMPSWQSLIASFAPRAAPVQAAQALDPERLGFSGANLQPEHLALPSVRTGAKGFSPTTV
jgi:hypothetical protein